MPRSALSVWSLGGDPLLDTRRDSCHPGTEPNRRSRPHLTLILSGLSTTSLSEVVQPFALP